MIEGLWGVVLCLFLAEMLYYPTMFRIVLTLAIVTNAVVGHVCMMPMALAHDVHVTEAHEHCNDCSGDTDTVPCPEGPCSDCCISQASAAGESVPNNDTVIALVPSGDCPFVVITDTVHTCTNTKCTSPPGNDAEGVVLRL